MFPCRCGHGFLRKVEDTRGYQVPAATAVRKKKKQNEKPKLNLNPKPVSQKGVGEYFPGVPLTKIPVTPPPPSKESAKVIPGLSVEGQKPLLLNLDLSSIKQTETKPDYQSAQGRPEVAGDGPSRPRTATSEDEDIFMSDEDLEEEEEKKKTEQWSRLCEEILDLRLENEKLKETMMTERRLYQKFQEELMRENKKLEMKFRDLDRSMQELNSDLQEKHSERIETIEELHKLVVKSSAETDEVKGK